MCPGKNKLQWTCIKRTNNSCFLWTFHMLLTWPQLTFCALFQSLEVYSTQCSKVSHSTRSRLVQYFYTHRQSSAIYQRHTPTPTNKTSWTGIKARTSNRGYWGATPLVRGKYVRVTHVHDHPHHHPLTRRFHPTSSLHDSVRWNFPLEFAVGWPTLCYVRLG